MTEADLFKPAAVSAETQAFNERLEAMLAEVPPVHEVPVEIVRQARAEGKGALPIGGPLDGSYWQDIPGAEGGPARVRISDPDGAPKGHYLHIHGGGWTIGQAEQYDKPNQALARTTGCRVYSVHYRLAPEHPWPLPYDDCMAAARWLLDTVDGPVVIGGESAGAHLTAATALGLRDEGLAGRVAGLVLNYGVFDLRGTPSVRRWGARYLVLSTPVMEFFFENIDPGAKHRDGPGLSPLLADLADLPPALFVIGTMDPLLDDTLFMAARWQAAGNRAELAVYPGGVHAFDMFDELAIAQDARARQAAFIQAAIG